MKLRRGDVVIVELDPTEGSEQRGTRPCLVVQNDVGNANAPTAIVAPLRTSFSEEELYPFEVLIDAEDGPQRDDSVVLCNQIRTVSIEHRILESLGTVAESRLTDVDTALEYSLGLRSV